MNEALRADLVHRTAPILAALLFGVGVTVILMVWTAADNAAWIGFAGNALGSAVALIGALVAVQYQARVVSRRFRKALSGILGDARRHILGAKSPEARPDATPANVQLSHLEFADKMLRVAKLMTERYVPDTPDLARAYMLIAEAELNVEEAKKKLVTGRFYDTVAELSDIIQLPEAAIHSALVLLARD